MDVFVNRTLNLKKIKFIGLDMDHTLIRYNSERFEGLAYQKMIEKLVAKYDYPKEILDLRFDFKSVIRGLVIDKTRGNLLKVSRYGAVRESYHGLKPTEFRELKQQFGTQFIDLRDNNYDTVDTTFSISHACLFAQLVELKDSKYKTEIPSYAEIADHLETVLDLSHRDGSIKEEVIQNLDEYVIKDPDVIKNISKFKKHGKHFFIVTNSDYNYTKKILDYAINPFLPEGEKWSDFFTWTITLANKPRFFYDVMPILKIDLESGTMSNYYGNLEPGVYQGGCAKDLSATWAVTGDQILYIGDHIYGDILRLKKDCEWRTGLVIEELKEEIELNKQGMKVVEEIQCLMQDKTKLEKSLDALMCKKIEEDVEIDEALATQYRDQIKKIDETLSPLISKQKSLYNPYWGEVMRVGIEESQFANQIERFADIYMPTLNDLINESPRSYFRSRRRQMAHDIVESISVE